MSDCNCADDWTCREHRTDSFFTQTIESSLRARIADLESQLRRANAVVEAARAYAERHMFESPLHDALAEYDKGVRKVGRNE